MGFDFTTKFGTIAGASKKVDIEGATFELLPRGAKLAQTRVLGSLKKKEIMTLGEDDDGEVMGAEIFDRQARMVAAHIMGWSDLFMGDTPVEYSNEVAVQLMNDYLDFRLRIEQEIDKITADADAAKAVDEEVAKN